MRYRALIVRAVSFAPVLLLAAVAQGAPPVPGAAPVAVRFGYDLAHTRYAEKTVDIEDRGWLHGGRAELTVRPGGSFEPMLGLEARAHFGALRYSGQTQSGTPVEADGRDRLLEGRLLAGRAFTFDDGLLDAYLGFGIRDWNNDINDPRAYERNITYLYSPLGVRYYGVWSGPWGFAPYLEYDLFWGGTVKSKLSDVDPRISDLENHQEARSGFGVAAGLAVSRDLGGWSLQLEPFIRMWRVDDSDMQTLFVDGQPAGQAIEPRNTTTQVGAALLVGF